MKHLTVVLGLSLLLLGTVAACAAKPTGNPAKSVSPWNLVNFDPNAGPNTASIVKTLDGSMYRWALQLTSTPSATEYYRVTGGVLGYKPAASLYFQDLYQLSTDWKAVTDWGGGSPRFTLAIDVDGDGVFKHYAEGGADAYAFAYVLQQWPSFNGGPANWTSTGNLVGATTGIWDTTQFGGPTGYTDYAGALSLLSGKRILNIMLVVDGGWLHGWTPAPDAFTQVVWLNNVKVNTDTLLIKNDIMP